ncbi:hypothetical protein [Amycolatopsis orientalis]|uniref:hypothetical protein n=1 Tax=Amycolatopsis orientalis TaxID=31958 RepID=UPI0003FD1AA0|nr:hypothetical protein [Amycolatopsis orientalis]
MNGPAHYREAERLLTVVQSDDTRRLHPTDVARINGLAQAHATLALAAATALSGRMDAATATAWSTAAGVKRS